MFQYYDPNKLSNNRYRSKFTTNTMPTMRAARFHAAKDIRVEEIPAPQPDEYDDKVLVEVKWCGICGSDLGEYLSGILRTDLSPPIPTKSLLTQQATQAHTQFPLPKRAHTL
jgi:hypothetical protein